MNYVIASYSGFIPDRQSLYKPELILDKCISSLIQLFQNKKKNNVTSLITQVTVVCPTPPGNVAVYDNYYQKEKWLGQFKEIGGVNLCFVNSKGQGLNYSYDQWIEAYLAYPDFDYYICTEDDYLINSELLDFDLQLKTIYDFTFPLKIGYLASKTGAIDDHPYHATISNGVISRQSFEKINKDAESGKNILKKFYEVKYSHPQIKFSLLFSLHDIKILDFSSYFRINYWNNEKMIDHTDKNVKNDDTLSEIFIPYCVQKKEKEKSELKENMKPENNKPELKEGKNNNFNLELKQVERSSTYKWELKEDEKKEVTTDAQMCIAVFGANIYWELIETNIELFIKSTDVDLVVLTDKVPELKKSYKSVVWEKLSYLHVVYEEKESTEKPLVDYCLKHLGTYLNKHAYKIRMLYYNNTLFFRKYNGVQLPLPNKKYSMRLLSHVSIMKNTTKICDLTQLSLDERENLFDCAFPDKVFDFEKFLINPNYFITNEKTPIFLIPSVSYCEMSRSYFSPRERMDQTLTQLLSIKQKIPEAKIVLLELTSINMYDILQYSRLCDYIILFDKHQETITFRDDPNKNKTEVHLLSKVIPLFMNLNCGWICKFGARYILNEMFDKNKFLESRPSFRYVETTSLGYSLYESILYSMPKKYCPNFLKILERIMKLLDENFYDNEHELFREQQNIDINRLEVLGIEGFFSVGCYNRV